MMHSVYTLSPSVVEGSHFFIKGSLCDTLNSLVHMFACHDRITNISHPETHVLLRQIQHFCIQVRCRREVHAMPCQSTSKLQEMGMRDIDREYVKAKEEDLTISL